MSGKPVLPPPCLAYGEAGSSHYGYRPSLAAGIIFVIIFGSYVLGHVYQTWRTRTLWLLFFVVGSGLECLGWVARLVSYHCAYSRPLFTMQTAVLIMGMFPNLQLEFATHKSVRPCLDPIRDLHHSLGPDLYPRPWSLPSPTQHLPPDLPRRGRGLPGRPSHRRRPCRL